MIGQPVVGAADSAAWAGSALVVEDHAATKERLRALLRTSFPALAVATATDLRSARAALRDATLRGVRLVLVDLRLPDGSGIDLIGWLAERHPTVCTVVVTACDDDSNLFGALAAGAQGYLLKDQEDAVLAAQLQRLEQGTPPLSPRIARRMLEHFRQPANTGAARPDAGLVALTPRETDVLACLGRGMRVPEAARALGLTDSTVGSYVKSVYAKLGIHGRAEAALEAARRGLIHGATPRDPG